MTFFDPPPHAMILTATPWQDVVECDERIAPLLQSLWQLNIVTNWSCEGEPARRAKNLHNFAYVQCEQSAQIDAVLAHLTSHVIFGDKITVHGSYQSSWSDLLCQRRGYLTSTLIIERDDGAIADVGPRVCFRVPAVLLSQAIDIVQAYSVRNAA